MSPKFQVKQFQLVVIMLVHFDTLSIFHSITVVFKFYSYLTSLIVDGMKHSIGFLLFLFLVLRFLKRGYIILQYCFTLVIIHNFTMIRSLSPIPVLTWASSAFSSLAFLAVCHSLVYPVVSGCVSNV